MLSLSKPFTTIPTKILPASNQHHHVHPFILRPIKATNNNINNITNNDNETPPPAAITPPETVEIRFKRGSRRRRKEREDGGGGGGSNMMNTKATPPPKKWEEMTLTEKAIELYVASLMLWQKLHQRDLRSPHYVPGPIVDKYADALSIAIQFFDVQKSGKLVDNKIPWRGDSGLEDGKEADLDLSKGLYDAGDQMKFGFPMAFTATVLSWTILEFGHQVEQVKEHEHARESLKWITDYLINAHPSANVLYIQVGDPELDHKCWERPEAMKERRPLIQVNTSYPGADVAAETAAAMASASLVFRPINSTYSDILLKHAKELFTFADTFRASYSTSIPQVQDYYNSTGYGDELLWAASWLYRATDDKSYLDYVTTQNGKLFANFGSQSWFSWDNKFAGTQVLLSRESFFNSKDIPNAENYGLQLYRKTAEIVMCSLLPDSPTATSQRTDGGLIWINQWDTLQYAVASAFLAVVYSTYMFNSQTPFIYCSRKLYEPMDLHRFAISQADYVLGNNPMKMSYLVGYGSDYPKYVHHRGASIPMDAKTGCQDGFKWLNSSAPNPNIAVGALVGGPFQNDSYIDSRNNTIQAEPTTYNTALLVGLLSALLTSPSLVNS